MRQVATYLSHYAPFKWMYITPPSKSETADTLIGTLTVLLWIQIIIITVGFFVLLFNTLNENIHKMSKLKTMLICFPIIPCECFLSYFLINNIVIMAANVIIAILFFIMSFESVASWENGGGYIYSSFVSYFIKIKEAQERVREYTENYNQLVKFKI